MSDARSSRGAKTLPQEFYTSSTVYQLESRRIFETHWLCVGRSSEVSEVGQSLLVEVEGESLLVVRTDQGLKCFFNVCRHRGTRLCAEDGERFSKAITCSYHAWSYSLDGRCIAAPNMSDVEGFDKADWSLHEAPVIESQRFLFLALQDDPPPDGEPLGKLADRLADWSAADLVPAARLEYSVAANWKLLFQNYNECYHCPRVHPALNAISAYDTAENDLEEGPVLGGPMGLADHVSSMTTTGNRCGDVLPGLSDTDSRRVYYFTVFPSLFVSPHPDYLLTHRIERRSQSESRIVCEFLFHPDVVARPNFDPGPAVEFWDETNKQDWRVCELSQLGVASRAYAPGPYSSLECTLAAFDRHYLGVLEAEHTP